MEHEVPYLLAPCPRQDRYIAQQTDRYIVKRICDGSFAGYVFQVKAGWKIEGEAERPGRPGIPLIEAAEDRVFAARHEAALFVYMRNRAYQKFVSLQVPPERIEIKVTPNFDQCSGSYGQWVAYLFKEHGARAGLCCADSLEEAKFNGLVLAHYMTDPKPTEEMRRISKELWKDIPAVGGF